MRLTTTALAATAAALTMAAPASAAAKPDLVVSAIAPQASSASPNASFDVAVTVRNAGRRVARKSTLRLVASSDPRASKGDAVLASVRTASLKPRKRVKLTRPVALPGAGTVFLIACADSARKVKESSERNNCRVSAAFTVAAAPAFTTPVEPPVVAPEVKPAPEQTPEPVVEPTPAPTPAPTPEPIDPDPDPATVDSDADGTPDVDDCAKDDAAIHPKAPDAADSKFTDDNCDGVDGVADEAIFVSPSGNNAAAGTRDAPVLSINAAIAKAKSAGKTAVMVQGGFYTGTVMLSKGISLYGGYTSTWDRSDAVTSTIWSGTVIGGNRIVGIEAVGIDTATRVHHFDVKTGDATASDVNTYGVRAAQSPSLQLEDLLIRPGNGAKGNNGIKGTNGMSATDSAKKGQAGACDDTSYTPQGGAGGVSPAGRHGGKGGNGGVANHGAAGATGVGLNGALGGPGGQYHPDTGHPGHDGDDGVNGLNGSTGAPGVSGTVNAALGLWMVGIAAKGSDGEHGAGGGGGGGGGGQNFPTVINGSGNAGGGGGGGGAGGTGGLGGTAGGSSFGVFAVNSTGITLLGNDIGAGNGGAGGEGGFFGYGGDGAQGAPGESNCLAEVGPGGHGGRGGEGGDGGKGGGGAGGSSYGLYTSSTTPVKSGNVYKQGTAGAGGGPNGVPGMADDTN